MDINQNKDNFMEIVFTEDWKIHLLANVSFVDDLQYLKKDGSRAVARFLDENKESYRIVTIEASLGQDFVSLDLRASFIEDTLLNIKDPSLQEALLAS